MATRNECNIIKDLIPLYAEGLASKDSASFVEEHIRTCDSCRAELEKIRKPEVKQVPIIDEEEEIRKDTARIKALSKKVKRKVNATAFVLALFLLVAGTGLYLLIGGISGGAKVAKQLDGMVFATAEEIKKTGHSYSVTQYSFTGDRVTRETATVTSDGRIEKTAGGSTSSKEETIFWVFKNPPGKDGTYMLLWLDKGRTAISAGDRKVLFDENGDISGIMTGSTIYFRLDRPLF